VPPCWTLPLLLLLTLAASFTKSRIPFCLALAACFGVYGALSLAPFLAPPPAVSALACETPVLCDGVLEQRAQGSATGGCRLLVRVKRLRGERGWRDADALVLVLAKEGRSRLSTGDRIVFFSKLRRPRNLGIPGENDFERRLAYQGVFLTGFVNAPDDLLLVKTGSGLRHRLDQLACTLERFIDRQTPGVEGGVLKALLLGETGDVPQELNDAYAVSGVNHILSISGFHVGIIFLAVMQLLLLVLRRSEFLALRLNLRALIPLLALPVVIFYLLLSGSAPATQRSVLMIAVLVAALYLKRELDPVNSLLLAAALILCAAPQTLFDLSFQLSFLAFWGLVVLAPALGAPCARLPKPLRWFLLLMAASAAAILATLVPVAYYFQRVAWIGLLSNLFVVPLMGYGAVVAGFAGLSLSLLAEQPAGWLLQLAALLVKGADAAILRLARVPAVTCYHPAPLDLLLACLTLCSLTFLKKRRLRLAASSLFIGTLLVRAVPAPAAGAPSLRVLFLSVGQGDAALIWLPDGKRMLIDGGGKAGEGESRCGDRLLLPALRRLDVDRIDFLVLSHEHPDHLQGVLYLAERFEIGEFWESGVAGVSYDYLKLKWVLAARGIKVRTVNGSTPPLAVGGVVIEPLWPPGPKPVSTGDANDSSLVFRVRYGAGAFLFTGDLTAESEEELLARGAPLKSALLKVGHHGSRYSSSAPFLAAVSPRVAVISAGYRNPFRLPSPDTLRRLGERGITVYRTDLDGSVAARLDSDGILALNTPWGHFR
jgi:competence protein ComEC